MVPRSDYAVEFQLRLMPLWLFIIAIYCMHVEYDYVLYIIPHSDDDITTSKYRNPYGTLLRTIQYSANSAGALYDCVNVQTT